MMFRAIGLRQRRDRAEHRGRHAEQTPGDSELGAERVALAIENRPTDRDHAGDDGLEGGDRPATKTAEPLCPNVFAASGIDERDRTPRRSKAVNDRERDERKKRAWLWWMIMGFRHLRVVAGGPIVFAER